jgi:uncharacterized protein YndB with AHSA1/START domain
MEKPLIETDTTVNADAKQVWEVLTASKSAMFMGADVDTDWKVGSPISFTGEFKGKAYRDHGEIRTADEGRELTFTHFSPLSGKPDAEENYNLVDIRLSPDGDERTKVSVSQTPLGQDRPDDRTIDEHRRNWDAMLEGLKQAAEERSFAES